MKSRALTAMAVVAVSGILPLLAVEYHKCKAVHWAEYNCVYHGGTAACRRFSMSRPAGNCVEEGIWDCTPVGGLPPVVLTTEVATCVIGPPKYCDWDDSSFSTQLISVDCDTNIRL